MTEGPELGQVTDRRPPFKYSAFARVWFSDTDAQGVVYYGRYRPTSTTRVSSTTDTSGCGRGSARPEANS